MSFRQDLFAEYVRAASDVPFDVWLRERDELARARQPKPGGQAVAWALLVCLGLLAATCVALLIGVLRGPQ